MELMIVDGWMDGWAAEQGEEARIGSDQEPSIDSRRTVYKLNENERRKKNG